MEVCAPMRIAASSPRSTAPHHTLAPSPISTSPLIDAVGATNGPLPIFGVLPLNGRMHAIPLFLVIIQTLMERRIRAGLERLLVEPPRFRALACPATAFFELVLARHEQRVLAVAVDLHRFELEDLRRAL